MDPHACDGHSHDHDHTDDDLGLSLRPYIDLDRVYCLNEQEPGMGQAVLKLHADRWSSQPSLQSPLDDPELLLHIPFTESVTIQSFTIRNTNNASSTNRAAPRLVKLFVNRDDLDFDLARDELPPQQEMELLPPDHFVDGTIDYPCRPAGRFQNISHLTIYMATNYGTNSNDNDNNNPVGTQVTFVGIKGKGTKVKRHAVETAYEAQGMLKDHQVPGEQYASRSVL